MLVEGLFICDLCGDVIFPDDIAPVKIEKNGKTHQFHFHNRHSTDCLAQEINLLRQRFAAQTQ